MTNMPEKVWFERQFRVDMGQGRTLIATAQIHQLGNQEPYFSVTGGQYTTKRVSGEPYHKGLGYMESGGMLHDDVEEFVPELQPYLKWHLCSVLSGPMHYLANATYHFKEGNYEAFKSTAVIGSIPEDIGYDWGSHDLPTVKHLLDLRLPLLIEAFRDDMVQLFGEEVSKCWQ